MKKLDRRNFLGLGLLQATAGLVWSSHSEASQIAPPQMQDAPSIMQGATDSERTQISVLSLPSQQLNFLVKNSQGVSLPIDRIETIKRGANQKVIQRIYISNLAPNQVYSLNVIEKDSQKILSERTFSTLDPNKKHLRVAIGSCFSDFHHDPYIWMDLAEKRPDIMFFIGDSVYVDERVSNPTASAAEQFWQRFSEARSILSIYYFRHLIPIVATWDDHDFGKNNADRSFPHAKVSKENFLSFFAQEESHCSLLKRGPGVSSALTIGSQLFLLLDDRSFRHANGSQDRYAHWGKEQEDWMFRQIESHQGTVWLMNGSQYFMDRYFWYQKDSIQEDHPVQLTGLTERLKQTQKKIIFVSGDVHFSEISRIEKEKLGYETLEITASGFHSPCRTLVPYNVVNPRRELSTNQRNYILVDMIQEEGKSAMSFFQIFSCSAHDVTNFSMKFRW